MCRTTRTAICHSRRRRICSGASRRIELCSNGCVHLHLSMVCCVHLLVCRWHTLVCSLCSLCRHDQALPEHPRTQDVLHVRQLAGAKSSTAAPYSMTPVMSAASMCATVAAAAAARRSFDGEQHERVSLERCLAHAVFTFARSAVLPVGNGGLELAHPRRRALDCRCVRQFSPPSLSVGEYNESSRLSLALAL